MRKRAKIWIIIVFVVLVIILLIPAFDTGPPAHVIQITTVAIYMEYFQYEHPAGEPFPEDLIDIDIEVLENDELTPCSPTTKTPWTKFLIVYNPKQQENGKKDWIMIVMGHEGIYKLEPVVLWNTFEYERDPNAVQLIKDKQNFTTVPL